MNDDARIGAPRKRKEDPRFLTGASCFTDDIALAGQLHGVVVRSPHAHARIRAVDLAAARAAPGVRLVLTAADIAGEVVRPIPSFSRTPPFDIRGPDGAMAPEAEQFPLAGETARYAGQPVVFVVAETLAQAQDAAELVRIDYEPRAAAIGIEQALGPEAPLVWDDRPSNVSFEWEGGDRRAVEAAFARAAHVTRVEVINNRIAPVFMEPRSAVAEYDPAASRWTLRVGCQSAHGMRAVLVHMMGIEPERLRVVVPDTGGGFGARGGVYPEYPLLLVAARRLGRPVKWTAERTGGVPERPPGARSRAARRAGAGRRGPVHGDAGARRLAPRRVSDEPQRLGDGALPPADPRRALSHPVRPRGHARRVLPHDAPGGLPGDRPHRGELPDREPDRGGGARDGDRPDRAPAAEPGGAREPFRGRRRAGPS